MGLWYPSGAKIHDGAVPTSYTDKDISPIVGSQRVVALISIVSAGNSYASFRPNGETLLSWGQYAGTHGPLYASTKLNRTTSALVVTDTNGIFEWQGGGSCQLYLEGWFAPSVAPAAVDPQYTLPGTWTDKDISGVIGSNRAMIIMRHQPYVAGHTYQVGVRPNGKTYDFRTASWTVGVGAQQYTVQDLYGNCFDTTCLVTDASGIFEIEADTGGTHDEILSIMAGEIDEFVWVDSLIYDGDPDRNVWTEIDTGEGCSGLAYLQVHYGSGGAALNVNDDAIVARKKGDDSKNWSTYSSIGQSCHYMFPYGTPGTVAGIIIVPMDDNGKIEIYPWGDFEKTLDYEITLLGYVRGGSLGSKSGTQFHNYWGPFATPGDLPNVSGASVQDGGLGVGDLAFVDSVNTMFQCLDSTEEAADWKQDPPAIHSSVSEEIALISPKASPTASDLALIEDAAASFGKKKATLGTLPYGRQPSAIHDNVAGEIAALTEKTTLVDADKMLIEDSAAADAKKMIQVVNLPPGDEQSNLWYPPASPHSEDDEFDSGTLDASWYAYNGSTGLYESLVTGVDAYDGSYAGDDLVYEVNPTTRPSWLLLQPKSGVSYQFGKTYTFPTNVLVIARMKFAQPYSTVTADDRRIALILRDDSGGYPTGIQAFAGIFLNYVYATQEIQARFYTYDGGVLGASNYTTNVDAQGQALEYVAIHKIGTTYHGWVGTAGGNWIYMGSDAITTTTPDHVTISVRNATNSLPGHSVFGVDFIRFLETSNFLF